ncbi:MULTISPECIES: hypothetical protein [Lichenihabitans]|uniref:hypothetical protein n=1 Tax=Lichenihabitans TaxID=2723776 RepID=UPI0013F147C5|nr:MULTISPECIES: hypothetical protein [Lichenihabitans]UDL93879.1 hypothetical protein LGH83_15125 [Lichenihabitans sp. PAMC28606]
MTVEQDEPRPVRLSAAAAEREARRTVEREARLAEALRENLKRRKAQARTRSANDI